MIIATILRNVVDGANPPSAEISLASDIVTIKYGVFGLVVLVGIIMVSLYFQGKSIRSTKHVVLSILNYLAGGLRFKIDWNELKKVITAGSPVELTKLGHGIVKDSGGLRFIEENLKGLFKIINLTNPKSDLDIQNSAKAAILEMSSTDEFLDIKDFIYQNPIYKDLSLSIPFMSEIFGIYLRNEYFKAHKDLENKDQVKT